MQAERIHAALALVRRVVQVRLARVIMGIGLGQVTGFQGIGFVMPCDQAGAPTGVSGIEPFAGEALPFGIGMVTVTAALLVSDEVVLRPITTFDALHQLQFLRVETAAAQAQFALVAALQGVDAGIAGNVVQAVARVVGAAHHFDIFDIQRVDHVDKRHIAVVGVAGDAIDQQLDRVDFTLAIEATKRQLAGGGALIELSQHDPWHTVEQLPAVLHGLLFQHVTADIVHRAENVVAGQRALLLTRHGDTAQRQGAVGKHG